MSTEKLIVCLAHSYKHDGRCVAGKEIASGEWIRPVSERASGELREEERRCSDGGMPELLDVIRIRLEEPAPHGYQKENWLVDPEFYWVRMRKLHAATLMRFEDPPRPLWSSGEAVPHGRNDRVAEEAANAFDFSLQLIRPTSVILRSEAEGGRTRVRAEFAWAGEEYFLPVTDPAVCLSLKRRTSRKMEHAWLTVSLGEPYTDGFCYKLVAAVIS